MTNGRVKLIEIFPVSLILLLDWRWGRRVLYTHITSRGDHLHIETQEQRERRMAREAQGSK